MSEGVPEGWKSLTIGDLSKVKRGASPRPIQDAKWWGGNIGWTRISDVTSSSKYLTKTSDYLSEEGVKKSVQIPKGEVILSICATIGRPIIVKTDVCIHDGFVWFDGLWTEIDREFYYYFLSSKEQVLASSKQTGTQGNLNTDIVSRLPILLPPLPEQKKIASILTSVDEVIETTQKQIDKLQDLKKATMNELLTKGIGHTEFKDSELGRIPKSWEVHKLNDLCSLHYGKSPKEIEDEDGKYPIYGTGGIVGKTNSSLHSGKSIVIGRKGSIDNVSFVKLPFWAIDTTYYVEAKSVGMKWLFYRLQYEGLKKYNEASGVPSLNRETLYNISIQSPPRSEQTEICVILDTVDFHISSQKNKLSQTQSLKKSLMQDLLTGKVRVQVN